MISAPLSRHEALQAVLEYRITLRVAVPRRELPSFVQLVRLYNSAQPKEAQSTISVSVSSVSSVSICNTRLQLLMLVCELFECMCNKQVTIPTRINNWVPAAWLVHALRREILRELPHLQASLN